MLTIQVSFHRLSRSLPQEKAPQPPVPPRTPLLTPSTQHLPGRAGNRVHDRAARGEHGDRSQAFDGRDELSQGVLGVAEKKCGTGMVQ